MYFENMGNDLVKYHPLDPSKILSSRVSRPAAGFDGAGFCLLSEIYVLISES